MGEAFRHLEVEAYLKQLNKPPIKTIQGENGDVIDCVDIYKQPAFDHPLLRNHTIQMRPSSYPTKFPRGRRVVDPILQMWNKKERCPLRTVPIRRITRADLLRAGSITNFGKKSLNSSEIEHATVFVNDKRYFGARAEMAVWQPLVDGIAELSESQIRVVNDQGSQIIVIQAGYTVNPELTGDQLPRFYIYWTVDGYNSTGCYNVLCPGFVQITDLVYLNSEIGPVSIYGVAESTITLHIHKDIRTSNWWLTVQDITMGYWPAAILNNLSSASKIEWGGEVKNTRPGGEHTSTQMGSGHFSSEGSMRAGAFYQLSYDTDLTTNDFEEYQTFTDHYTCYTVDRNGNSFYYGGPGKNPDCP
ncbi:uncharacterized protein LOC18424157 [Amborella trichopoda]|nr:uncharacterized protein LOC18424157 [Amborella trichopoda]|eukprot:XP_020532254.1 uncharacterized protein LOC18424157 [Amborella trichopoda]